MDIARLGIEIDSRPAGQAADRLDELTAAGGRSEKAVTVSSSVATTNDFIKVRKPGQRTQEFTYSASALQSRLI